MPELYNINSKKKTKTKQPSERINKLSQPRGQFVYELYNINSKEKTKTKPKQNNNYLKMKCQTARKVRK